MAIFTFFIGPCFLFLLSEGLMTDLTINVKGLLKVYNLVLFS